MAGRTTRAKRQRLNGGNAEQQEEQPAVEQQDPEEQPEEQADQAPQRSARRRDAMAAVARKRAAHFANFQVEADDVDRVNNVHVGNDNIYELGPWSSARALVDARAAAQQERNDRLAAGPSTPSPAGGAAWTPTRNPSKGPRTRDCVPSLFSLCVGIVVEHLDCVETLWGLPEPLKVELAVAASVRRKLNPDTTPLFTEHVPSEVVLLDCSALDKQHVQQLLSLVLTPSLQKLHLRFCGRGLAPDVLSATVGCDQAPLLPALTTLALEGAYRLTDEALQQWLARCPGLLRLELPEASKLEGAFLPTLATHTPSLRTLNLYKCRGVASAHLLAAVPCLASLTSLNVGELAEVDDATLAAIATACPGLEELHIDKCTAVTDKGVEAIAAGCPALRVLWADNCSKLSDVGLDAIAEHCPRLEVLSVRRCYKLSDQALAQVASRCSLHTLHVSHVDHVGPDTMAALASVGKERLCVLDVSFCRRLTDDVLGGLVDSCPHLERLHVFGCSQLTTRFLHGHARDALDVQGMGDDTAPVVVP